MKTIALFFTAIVVLIAITGCRRAENPLEIDLLGKSYKLKEVSKARPVDLSGAEFVGHCSVKDQMGIALCLGQIDAPQIKVTRVEVVWSEYPIAARAKVDDAFLYLVREEDGSWVIKDERRIIR
jgi:hypothetical protein